jgi:hypothetical protein
MTITATRRRLRRPLIALAALLLAAGVLSGCEYGNTYANLSATSTGITWSAHITGFTPNAEICYWWEIWRNDVLWERNGHCGYFTDRYGNHYRLPSGFPQARDCGPGKYVIFIWAEDYQGNKTPWDSDTVFR